MEDKPPLMPPAYLLESALPSVDHAAGKPSCVAIFGLGQWDNFFVLSHVFLSLEMALWGGYLAAYVRLLW